MRKENNLSDFDLSFGELDKTIIPQLLPIAESIKMQISNRLHMRKVLPTEEFRYPGGAKIGLFGKSLTLSSDATKISFSSFLDILQPFIDSDAPENSRQDNEYFSEESIFSPIKNTLSRSKIGNTDIDYRRQNHDCQYNNRRKQIGTTGKLMGGAACKYPLFQTVHQWI